MFDTPPKLVRTTDGHLLWLTRGGRFLPVIRGGSDEGDAGGDPPAGTGDGSQGSESGAGDDGALIPQSKVAEIAAREKAAGKRARERELAEELGMSLADVKKLIEGRKADELANKSEAERAMIVAKEREAEAERMLAEAAAIKRTAMVQSALAVAGAPLDIAPLIPAEATDEADIAAAVEDLRTRLPGLFTAVTGKPGTQGYTPPNPPSGQSGGQKKKPLEAGRERALARLGKN